MSKRKDDLDLPVHLIDRDSERFVVGSVLAGGWPMYRIAKPLMSDGDLTGLDERKIWEFIVQCAEAGDEPSSSAVMRRALDRGTALAFSTVMEIEQCGIPGVGLDKWIHGLRRKAIDREAYRLSELIGLYTQQGYSANAAEIIEAREKLGKLERMAIADDSSRGTIASLIEDCGGWDRIFAKPERVIEPPFALLREKMNGGFAPGSVTVIGARPSVGKSAFAIQCGLAAAGANHRALFFSLEMQKPELLKRIVAVTKGVDYGRLVRGTLDRSERAMVRETEAELKDWPLEVYCDLFDLRSIAARIASDRPKCEFAIIDYLGLIESGQRAENRNQELSYVSRRIKMLAMETGIPLLVLHQLNRGSETDDRRPMLRDLRDSGSIEQDADNVLFLHQPGARKPDWPKDDREIIIAKQRNGERDQVIPMRFEGRNVRFTDRKTYEERVA